MLEWHEYHPSFLTSQFGQQQTQHHASVSGFAAHLYQPISPEKQR